jgi:cytochrome P450
MARAALPPGPPGLPYVGNLVAMWGDPLAMLLSARARYGDTHKYWFGPYRYVLIHKPDDIRRVLVTHHEQYPKSVNYQVLKMLLGDGLLTSEGALWKRQRKLATPAFHHARLVSLFESMRSSTNDMLARWERTELGRTFDLHHEMMRLTFRIVGQTLFSTDLESEAAVMRDALSIALKSANDYMEAIVRVPRWIPTPRNRKNAEAHRTLDDLMHKIIDERRGEPEKHHDLLSMLMMSTDESGTERMTDQQLRDEVMTLVLAGHETTANALTFAFYLLSKHPEVARRVRSEVQARVGDREIGFDDLPKLEYTGQVIDEAMRLYPPAWLYERQATVDDELDGYFIPKGTIIAVCPWTLHRHPDYWDNPEGFDPDRFAPAAVEARPRYVYLPFGGGPRTCIGMGFAKMEAKIILASVLRRVRLDLLPGQKLELDPLVTLRPKNGLPMRVVGYDARANASRVERTREATEPRSERAH